MKKDEVAMLKSTGIKIDDDKTLVAIVDYHTEKELGFDGKEHVSKGKSFYRTDLIVRTNQEWKDLIAKFTADPLGAIKELLGIDLDKSQVDDVVKGVTSQLGGLSGDAVKEGKSLLDKIKAFFGRK